MRRLGASSPKRLRAEHRNEVWSWDLLYDLTEQGRTLRILTLIDEYTKECLTIHAGYSIRAVDAITVLEAAIQRYGPPQYLRSDNGPEFIAQAIQDWLKSRSVQKRLYSTRSTLGTGLYRKLQILGNNCPLRILAGRKFCGRQIAQRAVRPVLIVFDSPLLQNEYPCVLTASIGSLPRRRWKS
jgi:hypothetical protein